MWQDTTLSLSYGRSCLSYNDGSIPRIARTGNTTLSFLQCCHGQATIMNDMIHELAAAKRTRSVPLPIRFELAEQQVRLYQEAAHKYLRNRSICKDDKQKLQHDSFQIYSNYFIFQLRRQQSLVENGLQSHTSVPDPVSIRCCLNVLQSYLELHQMSEKASRMWLLVHITLSCAYFLGVTRSSDEESKILLIQKLCESQKIGDQSMIHQHYVTNLEILKRLIENNGVSMDIDQIGMGSGFD